MLNLLLRPLTAPHVQARRLRERLGWLFWLSLYTVVALGIGAMMLLSGPSPAAIAWIIFFAGAAAVFYQPRYGMYLIVFFALVGDVYIWPWYPFTKNFSSWESMMFVNDALIISPLESYMVLMIVSWLLHGIARRNLRFFTGPLFWPALVFLGFSLAGFAYGYLRGGDMVIGLWELRPVVYLILMLWMSSNLFERREHAIHLMWFVVAALFIEGIAGTYYYLVELGGNLEGINQITEHAVAIHMNSVFIFAMAVWLYRTPGHKRAIVLATLPFMLVTYLATQRRTAFLTLMIAVGLLLVVMYLERRRLFWTIMPPLLVVSALYIALFWNNQGQIYALPVEALKSVVAPEQASARDQSSNDYRFVENYNLSFTIHSRPLTGIGFGQKFYVVIPMADISFFSWWQYLPHNSVIWVWLKTGVFGFIAFLFLVSTALMQSAQAVRQMPDREIGAVMLAGSLYLVMHFIYAYFDISFDARSMIYVGAVMGMANVLPQIVAKPLPVPAKRWPWQPDPEPDTDF